MISPSGGISAAERDYIIEGVNHNVRNDGRSRMDFRHFSVEKGTHLLPNTHGAARVKLGNDLISEVLVGVKAEIAQPEPESPKFGKVKCSVDCFASVTRDLSQSQAQNFTSRLTRIIEKAIIEPNTIPLESLCIIPGKVCWILYIDVLVLSSGGNLIDAISLAIRAALLTTSLPPVEVVPGESGSEEDMDFELIDDPYRATPVQAQHVPITITLSKIGSSYLVADASLEEEQCASCQLSVAVDCESLICSVQMNGPGALSFLKMDEVFENARRLGSFLIKKLDSMLANRGEDVGDVKDME
eukprot:TRINITY_DN4581_c0_g1_i2.p1 TRINITY_DN4581_c0_g1~~TRINITY_DN4581_c0_g1_i2.p1  ORF type:complete len:300 (+),score=22.36 TRINITY_DN4581_c0_g1_i2:87-986(+)